MRIENLRIARYRSLYDVSLKPGDFTVLVGPNNAGKTNFVDAVDFLAEAYRFGLDIAVARKGGFENIAHRKMRRTKKAIAFEVVATLLRSEIRAAPDLRRRRKSEDDPIIQVTHRFEIGAKSQAIEADYHVIRESVKVEDSNNARARTLLSVERVGDGLLNVSADTSSSAQDLVYPFSQQDFVDYLKEWTRSRPGELIVSRAFFSLVLASFAQGASNTRVYQIVPLEGRRPGVPTPIPELDRHGANLPAFVANLKRDSAVWPQIMETMRRVVPGLLDIDTSVTPDRRLSLQFYERGVGKPWSSEDISDGTIQTLALLVALYDPRTEFVLIEEPENSIHPWIIRDFVEACRRVTGKQVMLTTHSPVLINTLRPDEVFVASRRGGQTTIDPLVTLDPDATGLWREGQLRVFDIIDEGWLQEAVPGALE